MKRIDKFNYAIGMLKRHNIKTTDERLTMNGYGDIVIHSKQLKIVLLYHHKQQNELYVNKFMHK